MNTSIVTLFVRVKEKKSGQIGWAYAFALLYHKMLECRNFLLFMFIFLRLAHGQHLCMLEELLYEVKNEGRNNYKYFFMCYFSEKLNFEMGDFPWQIQIIFSIKGRKH